MPNCVHGRSAKLCLACFPRAKKLFPRGHKACRCKMVLIPKAMSRCMDCKAWEEQDFIAGGHNVRKVTHTLITLLKRDEEPPAPKVKAPKKPKKPKVEVGPRVFTVDDLGTAQALQETLFLVGRQARRQNQLAKSHESLQAFWAESDEEDDEE